MAGIDKTYLYNVDSINEVVQWLKTMQTPIILDDYGNELNWHWYSYNNIESIINNEITAEEYLKNYQYLVLWNTSELFDVWLIRHCPCKSIQSRLQEQYGEDYINKVLNHLHPYDLYKSPELSTNYSILRKPKIHYSCNIWRIEAYLNEIDLFYNTDKKQWCLPYCPVEWNASACIITGKLSKRKITRLLKKWKLPKGVFLCFQNIYSDYLIKTK